MKSSLRHLLVLFVLMQFIPACERDNVDEFVREEQTIEPVTKTATNGILSRSVNDEETAGLDLGCLSVDYPFTLIDNLGNEHPIGDDDAYVSSFDSTNADGSARDYYIVDFKYPLAITLEDGEQATVTDASELGEVFAECIPDEGFGEEDFPAYLINYENSCVALVYPVHLQDLDGNPITADDEDRLVELLAEQTLLFDFPLLLANPDGVVDTVLGATQLFDVLISCNEIWIDTAGWIGNGLNLFLCYELSYPAGIVKPDGSTTTVNNHEELCQIMLANNFQGFDYPITLIGADNMTHTASSDDEVASLVEDCESVVITYPDSTSIYFGDDILGLITGTIPLDSTGLDDVGCYSINYPVVANAIGEQGQTFTLTIEDENALWTTNYSLDSWVYPVRVTRTSDQSVVELDSAAAIEELLLACQ